MHRFIATELPVSSTSHPHRRASYGVTRDARTVAFAETLWQLRAGEQAATLTCHEDVSGCVRVVSTPDLLHYMKGWLIEEVSRYARRCGWRLAFVA